VKNKFEPDVNRLERH